MSLNIVQCLNQIATYCRIQGAKISIDANSIPTCVYKNKTTVGALNIALMLIEASKTNLSAQNSVELAQIYEWFEYTLLYCTASNSQVVIKDLNDHLSLKTFLVNDRLTIADIILYYAVYNIVENMTYLEKEKFVHFSRWFDNMQQDKKLLQKNKSIDFSTNYLVSVAPARH